MSRYIDTDEIKRQWDTYGSFYVMDRILADVFPTVDAVEVVRCENCIYGKPYNEVWYQPKRDSMWCKKYETEHEYGWFCADGENVTVGALIAKILRQTERR